MASVAAAIFSRIRDPAESESSIDAIASAETADGEAGDTASTAGVGTAALSAGVSEMEDSGCTGSVVISFVLSELSPIPLNLRQRSGIPECSSDFEFREGDHR